MKIGLYNYGTRGDLQPFISLAIALKKNGHDVRVVCISPYASDFSRYKKVFDLDIDSVLDADFYQHNPLLLNELERDPQQVTKYFDYLHYCAHVGMRDLVKYSDVIIAAAGAFEIHGYAEYYGKKMINLCLQYHLIPSCTKRPKYIHEQKDIAEAWLDIENHHFSQQEKVNKFRAHIGLAPLENAYRATSYSSQLNLVAISHVFCDQLSDGWSDRFKVCGYIPHQVFELEKPAPLGLDTFFASGDAPVFFSMGSAAHFDKDPIARFEKVIAAASAAGKRLIVQRTNNEDIASLYEGNERVFVIDGEIDHQKVMPHCALVIHHGGTGTTHAACLSGRPSIVLHYWGDMPDWAEDMKMLGVAGDTVYALDVTVEWLANEIQKVLSDQNMLRNAEEIGRKMRAENPLAKAIAILEQEFDALTFNRHAAAVEV